jgi:hypothetical protein
MHTVFRRISAKARQIRKKPITERQPKSKRKHTPCFQLHYVKSAAAGTVSNNTAATTHTATAALTATSGTLFIIMVKKWLASQLK